MPLYRFFVELFAALISAVLLLIVRDVTKRCGNTPKKLAILNKKGVGTLPEKLANLKQLQTHFKAKHEKGVGTPFPRVPAPLHPCSK